MTPPREPRTDRETDDRELIRTTVRSVIDTEPDMRVVGEAATGVEAVELADQLHPDVVVVVTSSLDEHGDARCGACGWALEDGGPRLFVAAVRAAATDDASVSRSDTVRLLEHPTGGPHSRGTRGHPLTARELEVVRAVARGRTNSETAAELGVSVSTVKAHLTKVQLKLNTRNRVEIAAWAWRSNLPL